MTPTRGRAFVGAAGWKKPLWRGHFYPSGLPQRRELGHASTHLTSLEINSTFYGLPAPSTFLSWRGETPDDFIFSVKGHKSVTQMLRLRNPAVQLAEFFASGVLGLGHKLGPVLWQLPAGLAFDRGLLQGLLAALPHTVADAHRLIGADPPSDNPARRIRHCVEARHDSFLDPAFVELLREHDVAPVVTNTPGCPDIRDLTSDFVYVRLDSNAERYLTGYDDPALESWGTLVNGWLNGDADGTPRDAFVYFKNPDQSGTRAPFDAMRLQALLDESGVK